MKQSARVAFGGISAALSLSCMLLSVFPLGRYTLPILAGMMLMPLVLEAGVKQGFAAYIAVAVLTVLIVPSLEAKVLFIALFGYYPVLKALLERSRRRVLEWILKIAVFNVTMVVSYWLMLSFWGLDAAEFEMFGKVLPILFLIPGNAVFIVYDVLLTRLIPLYWQRLHPALSKIFFRGR